MKNYYVNSSVLFATLIILFLSNVQDVYSQELNPSQSFPGNTARRQTTVLSSSAITNSSTGRIMSPGNDNFANASLLTVGAGLTTGTNYLGSLESSENTDCNSSTAVSSVWYYFSAGANTTLYVNVYDLFLGSYYTGAEVWNTTTLPTGNCPGMQCQDNEQAGLGSYSMELTNLSNINYYIQVTYPSTTDPFNNFEISVTTAPLYTVYNPPATNTCATAVAGCYINSYSPSTATIQASCPGYQFAKPPYPTNSPYPAGGLRDGYVYSLCYYFTNLNTSGQIDIQNLLYTCSGNTLWMDWTLYDASCNLVSCGNLSNLTVSGVGCNTKYTICQTFEAACNFDNNITANNGTKKGIIPYASWPSSSPVTCTVLPIELKTFNVDYEEPSNSVYIDWVTATETNNKEFTVEKTTDNINWQVVFTQPGAGTSGEQHKYYAMDETPSPGLSYYRLKQTDFDGHFSYSSIVPLDIPSFYSVNLFPNPTTGNMTLKYSTQSTDPITIKISDISGKVLSYYSIEQVQTGINDYQVSTASLSPGMYFMQVSNAQKTFYLKFVKE